MDDIAQMLMNEEEDYNAAFVDGEEIGKKAGLIEGQKTKSLEIARKMLAESFDYKLISKITNLSIKQIKSLQN